MGCCYSEPEPMNGGFNETKIRSQEEARRRYLSSTPSYSAGALVQEADFLVGVQGLELLVGEEQLHVEEAGVVEQVHLVEEADAAVVADKID